jgi:hypothetical protein
MPAMKRLVFVWLLSSLIALDVTMPHLPGAFRFDPSESVDAVRPEQPARALLAGVGEPAVAGPGQVLLVDRSPRIRPRPRPPGSSRPSRVARTAAKPAEERRPPEGLEDH